jgi:NAD(P)-dependent dehydrogenase (short-subunit alcohol dehydrogenase family)
MEKCVLITDIDTPLGYQLAKLYSRDGNKVIGTISGGDRENSITDIDTEIIDVTEWHRHSPVEAKNLVLKIQNNYKHLHETLIVQSIHGSTDLLQDTVITDIDKKVDYWLKGLFFLTREIIKTYQNQGQGALYFLQHTNPQQDTSALLEAVKNGTRGFTGYILRAYQKTSFTVNCLESSYTKPGDFAAYAYKQITGRLHQYTGKRVRFQQKIGLFAGIKKPGK